MTKPLYTPCPGTLPSMVLGYFQNNHDEYLTLDDIADKFSCSRGNIHTQLALALEHGLLVRERDADGQYIYKRGAAMLVAVPKFTDVPAAALAPKAKRKPKAPPLVLPNLATVKIEPGVPIPPTKSRVIDWPQLLDRMKAGDSCKLPLQVRATVSKVIYVAKKNGQGEFAIRTLPESQELRLWRVS